jgi:hypothetical protein
MLYTPLMASDKSRVASDGAGNKDPEDNADDYDPGWRGDKHSYTRVYSMVLLMQDNFFINYVYGSWGSVCGICSFLCRKVRYFSRFLRYLGFRIR